MRLKVAHDYSLRFSDGSTDIVQVISDDSEGWYTVRDSYEHPDTQESAPKRSININHAVSIEEYYFKRLTRQEISNIKKARELQTISDRIKWLENTIPSAEHNKKKDIADKSANYSGALAILGLIIVLVIGYADLTMIAPSLYFGWAIVAVAIYIALRAWFNIIPNEYDRQIQSTRQEIEELKQKLRR